MGHISLRRSTERILVQSRKWRVCFGTVGAFSRKKWGPIWFFEKWGHCPLTPRSFLHILRSVPLSMDIESFLEIDQWSGAFTARCYAERGYASATVCRLSVCLSVCGV